MIAMAKPHQRRQALTMTTHYVVLWVKTRELLYSGRSIDTVAELLEPGTCHGQGRTESEARIKANALASRAERAGAILVACGRRPVPQHRPLTWMERDVYEPTEDEIETLLAGGDPNERLAEELALHDVGGTTPLGHPERAEFEGAGR